MKTSSVLARSTRITAMWMAVAVCPNAAMMSAYAALVPGNFNAVL